MDELLFLKNLSQLERKVNMARVNAKRGVYENSQSEGDNLSSSDEDSRDDDDDYEPEGIDDEEEEEESESSEEEEDDEQSSSPSFNSQNPKHQEARRKQNKQRGGSPNSRLCQLESAIHNMSNVMQALAKAHTSQHVQPKQSHAPQSTHTKVSSKANSVQQPLLLAKSASNFPAQSSLSSATGMEGCPEIPRPDLMSLEKFEKYEIKYKEYLDKATDRKRTSHLMVHGFRKYHHEVRAAMKSLFDKNAQLRQAYQSTLPSYNLSEEQFFALDNKLFEQLYKELCTHQSVLPSQLLLKLEATSFDRTGFLPGVVIQASSAFREKLQTLPRQTVDSCTVKQLKEAFIKMLLGNDDRNLADFPNANTWEDVVSRLLDMDGSSQANTLLERIARVKEGRSSEADKIHSPASSLSSTSPASRGGGAARGGGQAGGQVRGGVRGGDPATNDLPDEAWKDKYEALRAQFKPTEVDLMGCTTYQQKIKRIMAIRDSRARENELKSMRGGMEGAEATASKPKQPTPSKTQASGGQAATPSRSQLSAAAEDEDTRACYNCGQKGHLSKNCPQPRRAVRRSPSPAADNSDA